MEQILNKEVIKKLKEKKYNVPVIGHFADKSVLFNSILQASEATKIPYHLIFECAIGKIKSAHNTLWEYKNGIHFLRYHAQHIRHRQTYKRLTGFNG